MKALRISFAFVIALLSASLCVAQTKAEQVNDNATRPHYEIQIKLDFDARSYSGSEVVHWINREDHSISAVYFHLYSNLRPAETATTQAKVSSLEDEEPRIEVTEVLGVDRAALNYSLEERGVVLRVNLHEPVPPGGAADIFIGFKGTVPEVDPEETSLTTHVVKQVSAALRSEREIRRARDLNLRSRGVLLLGTAYPVLVVRDGDDWQKKVDPGVGDLIFNDVADYDVSIEAAPGVDVFAPAVPAEEKASAATRKFSGSMLRDFVIIAGRNLRMEQREEGEVRVRSVFLAEHERVGKRVLQNAADAVRIFRSRFGALPFKSITVAEAPLIAGLGSTEFSGIVVIASAFYVDFDAPAVRNLPEIIREQQPSVEQSVEWTVARLISHQWWGAVVGNNPAREPVLDEALAAWSALLYFRELYGEQKANTITDDQLRGVYRLYRTFGGADMDADRASREYYNTFQYSAVVTTKGALMFLHLQRILGEQRLLTTLRKFYEQHHGGITTIADLREAIMAETPTEQRRLVARTLDRWLSSKRGDEDIATPDQELATSLGLRTKPNARGSDRNALGAFTKVGKFFWQQMTRIR